MPVVWSFDDDKIFGELTRLFGDREPLEVRLVAGGEKYPLTPPDSGPGNQAEYVAVEGNAKDVSLEVTYDGLTQTLDVGTGKLDKGAAAGLYELPKTKIKIKDCPTKEWFTTALIYQQYECQYTTAAPSPYVANKWAKKGHTWLVGEGGDQPGAVRHRRARRGARQLRRRRQQGAQHHRRREAAGHAEREGQRGRGVRDARLRHHRPAAQDDADPA